MKPFRIHSFPVFHGPIEQLAENGQCPFSTEVMADYLGDCHRQFMHEESPISFSNFEFREKIKFQSRTFWVWICLDDVGRIWDIVVGSGKTAAHQKTGDEIWMTGDVYVERHSPRELIENEYPEHKHEKGKSSLSDLE